jgi:hypothetical protein
MTAICHAQSVRDQGQLLCCCVCAQQLKCDDLSRIGGETPTPPSPTRLPDSLAISQSTAFNTARPLPQSMHSSRPRVPRVHASVRPAPASSSSRQQHHLRAPRAGVQSAVHAQLRYGSGWWALELEESKLSHPNQ